MNQSDVTTAAIVQGLERLGLRPPCHLMVHASLSKFGQVADGATTVVAALRETAGADGAAIIPSFRDAIRSEHYALQQCRSNCPQTLCTSHERGYTGAIGEAVRQQPDAVRSCHPTHSWVGIGAGAAGLLDGHHVSRTPCGTESPYFRLMEQSGAILLLGVGVNSITNVHAVEDARNVPYLSAIDPPNRHATYTTSGRRIQYRFPEMLHTTLESAGILRATQIGAATCLAIDARGFGSFLWVVTEDDPWCLVLRPDGDTYEPEQDARRKTARMGEVWRRDADQDAWQQLLESSRRPREPVLFQPVATVHTDCPAYRGVVRSHHRCAANDIPPWESFDEYSFDEPGVATCGQCNWRMS